jgi:5-methylthioadenosine/S-adenosylhomocysteine deaminase
MRVFLSRSVNGDRSYGTSHGCGRHYMDIRESSTKRSKSLRSAGWGGHYGLLCLLAAMLVLCPMSQAADLIVRARTMVTMDAERRVIEDGAIAIEEGRIVAVGPRADVEATHSAAKVLDYPSGILMPGLLNTHTHAAMSLFRGIANDRRLDDWLQNFIFPAEARNVTRDFVYWGTRLAAAEMLLGGTTLFVDMYYFEEEAARAAADAGIRAVAGQTIIQFPVPDAATPAEGLARAERFLREFQGHPLVTPAVAPHALYTNDRETLVACRKLADRYGVPLVIHLSETRKEQDDMRARYGKSPAAVLNEWGIFDGPTIAAHGVWLSEADLDLLRTRKVGIAHNPASNMMLSSGAPPIGEMRRRGIPVGLGTDGPAGSNNDFNLFEEMDLAGKLAKVTTMDPTALRAEEIVAMATIEGARSIHMEDQVGSLETGKRADWLVLDADALEVIPLYEIYAQIVYAFKAHHVRDVMVNGVLRVRDGALVYDNPRELRQKAREFRDRVVESLRETPENATKP